MKNSKVYSKKVQKLYRSLKRKYPKPEKGVYEEPVEALVYAIISENMTETATASAMKTVSSSFVDWNDLRVSLTEEIVEVLGTDTTAGKNTASVLTKILGAVFRENNTLSLTPLLKMGKRPARQMLEKMEGTSPFIIDYFTLTALQGHAIPLTRRMIQYLKDNELVYPSAGNKEITGFLTRQIPAKNGYEFYALLRRESESTKRVSKKKTKKTKLKKKAVRKTKTRKAKTKKTKTRKKTKRKK